MRTLLSSLVIVIFITISSSLKAQDSGSQIWQPRTTGTFETDYVDTVGGYIVMANSLGNAINPAVIEGKQCIAPMNIWDPKTNKMVDLTSNWVGDPMLPVRVFKVSNERWFITDEHKIYRADVDWKTKSINYELLFQGNKDSVRISDCVVGEKNIYFVSSWGINYLYICNMLGQIRKIISLDITPETNIGWILSMTELDGKLWIGYSFAGGLPDGSGLGSIDTTTGFINMVTGFDYNNNLEGIEIRVINGIPFMVSKVCGSYQFAYVLYYYNKGVWRIIGKGDFPRIVNGKMYIAVGDNRIFYPTGDTIKPKDGGWRELIKDEDAFTLGSTISPIGTDPNSVDPRWKIPFPEEEFALPFRIKYGYSPYIDYMYTINGKTYGIGPDVIAELVTQNSTAVKSTELKKLSVYPNPATNVIHISDLNKETDYEIYDLQGKMLLRGLTMDAVDISSLPPGIYVLSTPGKFAKVIKE